MRNSSEQHEKDIQRIKALRLMDASLLEMGKGISELPETYVIFTTEKDVIGKGESIYKIDRYIRLDKEFVLFEDGSHIIYVNGEKTGTKTEIEKLMHDFICDTPSEMYYQQLAKTMSYYKENERGIEIMCKAMEEMRNEAVEIDRIENAKDMIRDGILSLNKIAEYSKISLDMVKELVKECQDNQ